MKYNISFKNPLTHYLNITLTITANGADEIKLSLPMWRPGRYEAANYAKNIRNLHIKSAAGKALPFRKVDPSSWVVDTSSAEDVVVEYEYFAFKMDAGNSLYDEEQIYINFINCMIYDHTRLNESCEVEIDIPTKYDVACGMEYRNKTLHAKDYYELVDSPLIASESLEHLTYDIGEVDFHIWINGKHNADTEKIINDFTAFSQTQVDILGEFPEKSYHFLLQILPYKFYHGVEHHDSTVICLGPGHIMNTDELYEQLLGVSSHELFHSWNIIKIRPKEMMPYKFNEPVVFPTGYVAEGFTTYYGDLFLAKSGVFDRDEYFKELNTIFRRHFSNFGRLNYSVIDSSLDLWIDGYAFSSPERKSSIYVEGAMSALCLDLMIRQNSHDKKCLDDVVIILWEKYGKTSVGYTHDDIQQACEEVYGASLDDFFTNHIEGKEDKSWLVNRLLEHVGCQLLEKPAESILEQYFGIRLSDPEGTLSVVQIAPGSIGEKHFSIKDEIISINGEKMDVENINQFGAAEDKFRFVVRRNYKDVMIELKAGDEHYFHQYHIEPVPTPSAQQISSFQSWCGCQLVD